ncbi:SMR family transporter [Pseudonocardia sp. TRM90224]|uniref:SMR family transporter n=1 Tax=Pseudonocardia sp. TRM90224 TaxID=2812678 RepID=UPI001E3E5305|nr:SMR family transporter [Pseudonocardia sp. TRM90224]
MTPVNIAVLLFAVASAAGGQVLLKYGMQQAATGATRTASSLALKAATSPWVIIGLTVFAISAVAWMITLSRMPLNIAYPFNALGYLVILTSSVLLLGERANLWTWIGTSTVVVGLIIVVTNRPA